MNSLNITTSGQNSYDSTTNSNSGNESNNHGWMGYSPEYSKSKPTHRQDTGGNKLKPDDNNWHYNPFYTDSNEQLTQPPSNDLIISYNFSEESGNTEADVSLENRLKEIERLERLLIREDLLKRRKNPSQQIRKQLNSSNDQNRICNDQLNCLEAVYQAALVLKNERKNFQDALNTFLQKFNQSKNKEDLIAATQYFCNTLSIKYFAHGLEQKGDYNRVLKKLYHAAYFLDYPWSVAKLRINQHITWDKRIYELSLKINACTRGFLSILIQCIQGVSFFKKIVRSDLNQIEATQLDEALNLFHKKVEEWEKISSLYNQYKIKLNTLNLESLRKQINHCLDLLAEKTIDAGQNIFDAKTLPDLEKAVNNANKEFQWLQQLDAQINYLKLWQRVGEMCHQVKTDLCDFIKNWKKAPFNKTSPIIEHIRELNQQLEEINQIEKKTTVTNDDAEKVQLILNLMKLENPKLERIKQIEGQYLVVSKKINKLFPNSNKGELLSELLNKRHELIEAILHEEPNENEPNENALEKWYNERCIPVLQQIKNERAESERRDAARNTQKGALLDQFREAQKNEQIAWSNLAKKHHNISSYVKQSVKTLEAIQKELNQPNPALGKIGDKLTIFLAREKEKREQLQEIENFHENFNTHIHPRVVQKNALSGDSLQKFAYQTNNTLNTFRKQILENNFQKDLTLELNKLTDLFENVFLRKSITQNLDELTKIIKLLTPPRNEEIKNYVRVLQNQKEEINRQLNQENVKAADFVKIDEALIKLVQESEKKLRLIQTVFTRKEETEKEIAKLPADIQNGFRDRLNDIVNKLITDVIAGDYDPERNPINELNQRIAATFTRIDEKNHRQQEQKTRINAFRNNNAAFQNIKDTRDAEAPQVVKEINQKLDELIHQVDDPTLEDQQLQGALDDLDKSCKEFLTATAQRKAEVAQTKQAQKTRINEFRDNAAFQNVKDSRDAEAPQFLENINKKLGALINQVETNPLEDHDLQVALDKLDESCKDFLTAATQRKADLEADKAEKAKRETLLTECKTKLNNLSSIIKSLTPHNKNEIIGDYINNLQTHTRAIENKLNTVNTADLEQINIKLNSLLTQTTRNDSSITAIIAQKQKVEDNIAKLPRSARDRFINQLDNVINQYLLKVVTDAYKKNDEESLKLQINTLNQAINNTYVDIEKEKQQLERINAFCNDIHGSYQKVLTEETDDLNSKATFVTQIHQELENLRKRIPNITDEKLATELNTLSENCEKFLTDSAERNAQKEAEQIVTELEASTDSTEPEPTPVTESIPQQTQPATSSNLTTIVPILDLTNSDKNEKSIHPNVTPPPAEPSLTKSITPENLKIDSSLSHEEELAHHITPVANTPNTRVDLHNNSNEFATPPVNNNQSSTPKSRAWWNFPGRFKDYLMERRNARKVRKEQERTERTLHVNKIIRDVQAAQEGANATDANNHALNAKRHIETATRAIEIAKKNSKQIQQIAEDLTNLGKTVKKMAQQQSITNAVRTTSNASRAANGDLVQILDRTKQIETAAKQAQTAAKQVKEAVEKVQNVYIKMQNAAPKAANSQRSVTKLEQQAQEMKILLQNITRETQKAAEQAELAARAANEISDLLNNVTAALETAQKAANNVNAALRTSRANKPPQLSDPTRTENLTVDIIPIANQIRTSASIASAPTNETTSFYPPEDPNVRHAKEAINQLRQRFNNLIDELRSSKHRHHNKRVSIETQWTAMLEELTGLLSDFEKEVANKTAETASKRLASKLEEANKLWNQLIIKLA